ncbi:MAG: epoxyqueuosine reductase [Armatimonadetes bacterium]|nr:epoxyqueuosine reductase [Armatimonadota bacterium]NIM23896.1 epoxyqueuosine reductase [Armatimonadota bacterium]NIM66615.1 epoxyqueuosine reductase [Armatimonadota bacterium]NIM76283.1 epoxyqueuosine reductase [Armatimonadota bacterium]NIN05977.1 epoxyqueuosine reductase [Armatimonadota bacterium]
MEAPDVKALVRSLSADLCGIAPAERFNGAPAGFRPADIDGRARSVIVYAKRLPASTLIAENCVPYTFVNGEITRDVDRLTLNLCLRLEDVGLRTVPIPSDDPYEYWESERSYGRAILSLRHAGELAGLGKLGKNTLLINPDFGNMIQLAAVLVDAALEPDPLVESEACPADCRLCLDACPQQALDGSTVDQGRCRPLSNYPHEKGYVLKRCNRCRAICPHALGMKR